LLAMLMPGVARPWPQFGDQPQDLGEQRPRHGNLGDLEGEQSPFRVKVQHGRLAGERPVRGQQRTSNFGGRYKANSRHGPSPIVEPGADPSEAMLEGRISRAGSANFRTNMRSELVEG
jgi:hypothetical protein